MSDGGRFRRGKKKVGCLLSIYAIGTPRCPHGFLEIGWRLDPRTRINASMLSKAETDAICARYDATLQSLGLGSHVLLGAIGLFARSTCKDWAQVVR